MNPRLKSSKKWTDFPEDYLRQIEDVFIQGFKEKLGSSELIVQGRIYPLEILLRVGVRQKSELRQGNFEISMEYDAKKKDALDRIHNCIDAAASMMDEYLDNVKNESEPDFPLVWTEYEFEGKPLFVQFTTVNTSLEAKADALLGEEFKKMQLDEAEIVDALDAADEQVGPTMFGGKKSKKKKDDLH